MHKQIAVYLIYVAVLIYGAIAADKLKTVLKNDETRNIFVNLLSSLIKRNERKFRSESSSSSISMEDSIQTHDRIGLLIPEILEFPREQKRSQIVRHSRTISNNREPDIFSKDLNLNFKNINSPGSDLNYERDGFQNTPKLQKFTFKSKTYPRVDSNHKFINDFTVNHRVNRHYTHKSPKVTERAHRQTLISSDFGPETPKKKRKHVEPHQVVFDELDTSNAKFLAKMSKYKKSNSKDHKSQTTDKSDISMDDIPRKRKDINTNLDKHRLLKNHSTSQNKHNLREDMNYKQYNKDRHAHSESNKEKRLFSHEKKHKRKNIKSFSNSADFVEPKIKRPKKLPLNKNINDHPNPRKNEFTLTISDIDEKQDKIKDIHVPYDPFEGSPLLTIDTNKYQSKHKVEPHEPSKKILRENINDKLKSVYSKPVKQQAIEIGMIDKYEDKHEQLDDNDSIHLQPREPDINIDNKHKLKKPINEQLMKKKIDKSLKMYKIEAQSTNKQQVEELDDDFSKAEILLTDSAGERDKLAVKSDKLDDRPDNDDARENAGALRYFGGGSYTNKRWLSCLGKKASIICRKACRGAYINVCIRLKCSYKAKRDLRNECNKSCKKTFGTSKYSSEESKWWSSSSSSSSISF